MEQSTDTARRADAIFEEKVRPHVDAEQDARKYVAIDVETGDFEIDRNQRVATDRLVKRRPEARGRLWLRRVGNRYARHFRWTPARGGPEMTEDFFTSDGEPVLSLQVQGPTGEVEQWLAPQPRARGIRC